jgi:hypothetical protein
VPPLAPGEYAWPGIPRTWDLSYAVSQAYAKGQPLRLVIYSADTSFHHTGKYFFSSDAAEAARPALSVVMAQP